MTANIDALLIGAGGYVGAEIARLLAGHSRLVLEAVHSRSPHPDLGELHPHLAIAYDGLEVAGLDTIDLDRAGSGSGPLAVFCALPHGASAALLADLIARSRREVYVADVGADFRFADPARFAAIYGQPHPAPELLARFHCGLPDLPGPTPERFAAQPGCFTTAVTLGLAPVVAARLDDGRLVASCVTGSSGSGASPSEGTHHPARATSMKGYGHLDHRHEAEMRMLLGRLAGEEPEVLFLPHSGPFVRGIHATLVVRLEEDLELHDVLDLYRDFYAHSPFVGVLDRLPALNEVRGGNEARIGMSLRERDLAVTVVIDNLVKGAAGGALQWMNRMLGLEPTDGLAAPALAWS
ncbi:MAG: N-acetyl-gamma-glutamyl-phosphate reductase [Planctomycetes bacterium]|nr:N-acetyl-gamma-glutamyl-phosphate reductase [Planctomycetota bacterium]